MSAGYHLAIAGWPVDHSLSPALWERMAAVRGLALDYGRVAVAPGDDAAWDALWSSELSAFNVTAPWKERAAARCSALDPAARRLGSANVVIRKGDRWEGHTTDGYGFVRGVLAMDEPLRGRRLAVLGTGGAGRAVARSAADAGADVTLISRTPSRVPMGCEDLARADWESLVSGAYDVVVNATPLGRGDVSPPPPVPFSRCCPAGLAVDLNYAPPVTGFLLAAHAAGVRTLNGLGMLVHQACLAAALLIDGDGSAAESYEEPFWAAARAVAPAP